MVGDDANSAAQTVSADADSGCKKSHIHNECCDVQALALIESALLRLEAGTYGNCLSCGNKISLARLDKNPATETCHSCDAGPVFKAN